MITPTRSDSVTTRLSIRAALPWMIVILALSTLPYVAASAVTPEGRVFTGAFINPNDLSAYLSAMRQGADGEWLFHFTFSPEPIQPRLVHLLYLVVGHLAHPTRDTLILWYQIARLAAGGAALIAIMFWVRCTLPNNGRQQRTAWFLIVYGSGLGWLFAPFFLHERLLLPDLTVPEWATFQALLTPHFALGLGLEAIMFGCALRMTDAARGLRWAIAGALAALGFGLVFPSSIPVAGLAIGIYLLVVALQHRRIPWREWRRGAIVIAPLVIQLCGYGIDSASDPVWNRFLTQTNTVPPPPLPGVMIGYGLIGVLALIGGWHWLRRESNRLVPIWAGVNLLSLYLPVAFSGRFVIGLILPVGVLAAYGLEQVVLSRWNPKSPDVVRRVVIGLSVPSMLVFIVLGLRIVAQDSGAEYSPFYLPAEEIKAANRLAAQTGETSLVLASYPIGNYLPRVSAAKVFLGNLYYTLDIDQKWALLDRFWDENTPDEWRAEFLRAWGITHIYQGRFEKAITRGRVTPPGRIIYQAEGVTIYTTINDPSSMVNGRSH